jgi:hypothetical protein
MKIKIPTAIVDNILTAIDVNSDCSSLSEKNQQKLFKRLLELWYFVYNKQVSNTDFVNLKFYIDIHKNELVKFDIMLNGNRFGYSSLLKILIDLIECNDTYKSGSFCLGYRIKTDFISFGKLTEVEIDLDKIFKDTKNKEYWTKLYPNINGMINDVYNCQINLDDYLSWLYNNIGIELSPVYNKKTNKLEKRFLTEERAYHHFNLALKLNLKNIWFKISDEGRLYSTISNLPKGSIPFLLLGGEKVVSIDLKNCQPLLLNILLDHKGFKHDCELGIFYDKLADKLSSSRSYAKLLCYRWIFFGSTKLQSGRLYSIIEDLYPGLMIKINYLKEQGCLSRQLQRIESNIFVKGLGSLKMNKVLRHDEVLVYKSNEDKIVKAIEQELIKLNIKIKYKINN